MIDSFSFLLIINPHWHQKDYDEVIQEIDELSYRTDYAFTIMVINNKKGRLETDAPTLLCKQSHIDSQKLNANMVY
jgi:hypothetical protein